MPASRTSCYKERKKNEHKKWWVNEKLKSWGIDVFDAMRCRYAFYFATVQWKLRIHKKIHSLTKSLYFLFAHKTLNTWNQLECNMEVVSSQRCLLMALWFSLTFYPPPSHKFLQNHLSYRLVAPPDSSYIWTIPLSWRWVKQFAFADQSFQL